MTVVAITGANGYLGSVLLRRLADTGAEVVRLVRKPVPGDGDRPFTLGDPVPASTLDGVDVLIHCAYDMTLTAPDRVEQVNVIGTQRLLDAAVGRGVPRIILLSSMSAYEGTGQIYGRAKLACEAAGLEVGALSLRPGIVYGPDNRGMAGALTKLLSLPVTPIMARRSHQFAVHEDDLAEAVLAAVDHPDLTGVLGVAHPEPLSFQALLEGLARVAGVTPRFVPIPWQPVHLAMRVAERARVPLPLRSDSLLGLVRPAPHVPRVGEWAALGVELRALPTSAQQGDSTLA